MVMEISSNSPLGLIEVPDDVGPEITRYLNICRGAQSMSEKTDDEKTLPIKT